MLEHDTEIQGRVLHASFSSAPCA
jgi:hypothetical protein